MTEPVMEGVPERADGELAAPPANRMTIALLSLAGLFVSGYLALKYAGFGGPIACGGSGGCTAVQMSPYACRLPLRPGLLGRAAGAAAPARPGLIPFRRRR